MKKHFKTENMAHKEERGKCVILNGKNSCLGQIETRWERTRRVELKCVQEEDIRGEMCSNAGEAVTPRLFFLWCWTIWLPGTLLLQEHGGKTEVDTPSYPKN